MLRLIQLLMTKVKLKLKLKTIYLTKLKQMSELFKEHLIHTIDIFNLFGFVISQSLLKVIT